MKKKITVVFVIILMVLNFICCTSSFAEDNSGQTLDKSELEKMTIVQDGNGNDTDLKKIILLVK